jgi:hypothetical protein
MEYDAFSPHPSSSSGQYIGTEGNIFFDPTQSIKSRPDSFKVLLERSDEISLFGFHLDELFYLCRVGSRIRKKAVVHVPPVHQSRSVVVVAACCLDKQHLLGDGPRD